MTHQSQSQSQRAPAVALRDVTFLHPGGRGVAGVNLTLEAGATLGLLGPNGSGKSTILGLVAGFRLPQSGALSVFGNVVTASLRRRLGVLFQDASLDPLMSVRETLWLHGRLFGMGSRTLRARITELLELTDLAERAKDDVEALSGGLKRRLELARAVLHQPELVLLDEPSLGLDPDSKARLWEMLEQINEQGTALLVATNDVAEAERYCQRVAFLEHGRIIVEGAPAELKRDLRRNSVRVEWPDPPTDVEERLAACSGVGRVTCTPPLLHVSVDDASTFVPELFRIADGAIQGIRIRESTLEDAYFQWVGAPLRSDPEEARRR